MSHELPDVQAGFRKGRGTSKQIANIHWIIEKATEFQRNIYFALLTMPKPFTLWITKNCGIFWKRWEYETTWLASWDICIQVKKQWLELDMEQKTGSKLGKRVCQGCILSPHLFNLYTEYIMGNAEQDEEQAGMKITGRNIHNYRYADNTTLMAESEEKNGASWWKWKRKVKILT